MPDLADGEVFLMQGSGAKPYTLKNTGGVYSCSCPAWRNQSVGIERRTCKHLRKLRGDAAEQERLGGSLAAPARPKNPAAPDVAPVLLAESWDGSRDIAGWWMSEKLDGVRAYWNGSRFLSRLGNEFHAPDFFLAGLPPEPLDGELFLDRKSFQKTVAIVRRQDKSDLWKSLKFLVFDLPASAAPFEERMARLATLPASAYMAVHPHQRARDAAHVREELTRIEALGGEGVMLREPASLYVPGRSATLLKVKSFLDDQATVIGHQPGTGRHKGRLGALLVRMASGAEFALGTGLSDKEREAPPPLGTTVNFRYQELSTTGIPRFPSYAGLPEEL